MTGIITTLTLISNISYVLVVLLIIVDKRFREFVYRFVGQYPLQLIFLTSLVALVFSMVYSNVVNFPPCELCWVQRIFMYPQVLLSYLAIRKKDLSMISYLLPMTVLGMIVAFYHSLVHWGISGSFLACTTTGGECAKVYVMEYGYITIPFMAFSTFVYLLTITLIYRKASNVKN
jgi:disulfide bond formation protein DsbB